MYAGIILPVAKNNVTILSSESYYTFERKYHCDEYRLSLDRWNIIMNEINFLISLAWAV